ncbi:MAG: histidine--tRNA ligase [Candidatus Blackburnbacteria bacterium RIFCSPLOWO2_01_FULL_41_27]|uniref:Histidine--tRNA ligase n=2 Tax=Candidatus Blackburniibacteriota TaxID=1817898 RepID=A0A1G1V6I4_9BACT|nr:MAG: histidine--tRNA ligase [Candidatus Blackburnbacteria bacterium RIFCSPHIGHO2_12_FULL_41_13b]OGY13081.1 MAG: histidine--tRNA ligase [Candidatus Blackburnbacteria bacterium RIFCSPLOWO2_01_FULL_41_27]
MKLQTLKGFRDFLPEKMVIRNEAIRRLRAVFEKYGFDELQTPALEYAEVLTGKYGVEAEKLMYLFRDPGDREVGLRYDLTVPFARAIANNPTLPKPFKRYQIQPAYRAENTQKGRYREFYQCDVDIAGSSSPMADAEIIAVVNDALSALGFTNYKIRVNSRQVLFSIMEKAEIEQPKWLTVIQSIDKLDKKSREEVEQELEQKNINSGQISSVFEAISKAKPDDFLTTTLAYARSLGIQGTLVFDPTLARGLDYYTGPIFESVVEEPKIGSITGGGRYDGLLKNLGGPDLPATGTTIGLDRVCDVIEELNLWPNLPKTSSKVLVTIFNQDLTQQALKIATELREKGIKTEVYPTDSEKMEKQLKYADQKGIPYVIIIGPEESEQGVVRLKNMQTGIQETVKIEELVKKLSV